MKLSEMSTRDAANCMADLAVPLGNIAKNPSVQKLFNEISNSKKDAVTTGIDMVIVLLPALFRDNFDDTVTIISVMTGKKPAEVAEQPIGTTIRDLRGLYDSELKDFFASQPAQEQDGR